MTRSILEGTQGLQEQQDHEAGMVSVPVLFLQLEAPNSAQIAHPSVLQPPCQGVLPPPHKAAD